MDKKLKLLAATLLAAIPVKASAQPAPPSAAATPSPADIEAWRLAVDELDESRLRSEPVYALEILGHLDRLARAMPDTPLLDDIRVTALVTAGRKDEALALIDRIIANRLDDTNLYRSPWFAALRLGDNRRAAAVIIAATRNVRAAGWPDLRRMFDERLVWPRMFEMRRSGLTRERAELAEALYRIGWPSDDDRESVDSLRGIMVEDRIARGDHAGAGQVIATIATTAALLPILTLSKYDAALPGIDRLALLQSTIARQDMATAEAASAAPTNVRRVFDRVTFLRELGRDAEVVRVAEPFTRNVAATVAADNVGWGLINEAVYALQVDGRHDEAVRLMAQLVALPIADNPHLISPVINHASVLLDAGRSAEALAYAERIDREAGHYASNYGRAVIAASITCALARLNRAGRPRPGSPESGSMRGSRRRN